MSADIKVGYNVAIIGAGTLGMSTSLMAKLAGLKVFIYTNQKNIIDLFGKKKIIAFEKSDDTITKLNELTHNIGADVVVNTSNKWL
ncbi:hypothetical protein ABTN14_18750, partial [Acinetobacter baumannii]